VTELWLLDSSTVTSGPPGGVEDGGARPFRLLGPQRRSIDPLALRHSFTLASRYSLEHDSNQ